MEVPDEHTEAITAEIARKLQTKEWKENAAKNNIFSDCAEPEIKRRASVVAPIYKFTCLNLGKRQRNN
jgi:tripartite-type tricarboxylate transporter receptor subunit TctC